MKAPPYAKFGRLLADLRTTAGFVQAEFAQRLKTTQQTVSRWESGDSRPRHKQIIAIADVLKSPPTALLEAAGFSITKSVATFDQPFPVDALQPESFERFSLYLIQEIYPAAKVNREGRAGHTQDGLDVTATLDSGAIYSFQCKRVESFGPAQVKRAISAHKRTATKKILMLSRVASPKARQEIAKHRKWEIWDKEDISREIRQRLSPSAQRRLVDTFFRGQSLALLGQNEPGPWQTSAEFFAPFADRTRAFHHAWSLIGRKSEANALAAHLRNNALSLIFLEGAGGAGKSKLLKDVIEEFETNSKGVKVYFLNPTDEPTAKSIAELGAGPKLLVVDDAHDRDSLKILFHYASIGGNQTKLLLSLRPHGMEYVRSQAGAFALTGAAVATMTLPRLALADAIALVKQVLVALNGPVDLAESIAKQTMDCPLAAVVGAQVVAKQQVHYEFAKKEDDFRHLLLAKFRDIVAGEIGTKADAEPIKNLLRILALVQPFYLEDKALLQAVTSVEGLPEAQTNRLLRLLIDAGVLFKRGGTYRLSPDLLADHVIEEVCVGYGGSSTGYAERVFDVVSATHLEHLLLNLGRLDWRRSGGDSSNSRLLDGLWTKILSDSENAGKYVRPVTSVAYFQPKRALDFLEGQVASSAPVGDLASIARNAAFNLAHVPRACACLWKMGKDDRRSLPQNPGHAIRVLAELCSVEPNKPIDYNKSVVDFALSLLSQSSAWTGAYSPFDVLKGILSTEGHTTTSTGRAIQMTGFLVNRKAVRVLREEVVSATIQLLDSSNLAMAVKAAAFLSEAIRYPMGILNIKVPNENTREWSAEFVSTLSKIETAIATKVIDPIVAVEIERSVSWHKNYRADTAPGRAAAKLVASLPHSLEYKAIAGFTDGWGHHFGKIDPDTFERDWQQHMESIARDLISSHSTGLSLWKFVEAILKKMNSVRARDYGSVQILFRKLAEGLPEFAAVSAERALKDSSNATAEFSAIALTELMRADRSRGTQLAKQYMATGDRRLQASVAQCYAGVISREWSPTEIDFLLIDTFFRSNDEWILRISVQIARSIAIVNPLIAIQKLRMVNFEPAPAALDEAFLLFISKDLVHFDLLTESDVDHFLGQLKNVPELNGYWTQKFLSHVSMVYSLKTAKFFMDRVEYGSAQGGWRFRPVNYGPYVHTPLQFRQSENFTVLLKSIWQWMKDGVDPENYLFSQNASHLFEAMFAPLDAELVAALEKWSESGTKDDVVGIAGILRQAPEDFVFTHRDFVARFLDTAEKQGKESLDIAIEYLYGSAISGVRTGTPGEPMPRDLATKKACEEILNEMPRAVPAHRLYSDILQHSNEAISRQLKDAEKWEE